MSDDEQQLLLTQNARSSFPSRHAHGLNVGDRIRLAASVCQGTKNGHLFVFRRRSVIEHDECRRRSTGLGPVLRERDWVADGEKQTTGITFFYNGRDRRRASERSDERVERVLLGYFYACHVRRTVRAEAAPARRATKGANDFLVEIISDVRNARSAARRMATVPVAQRQDIR